MLECVNHLCVSDQNSEVCLTALLFQDHSLVCAWIMLCRHTVKVTAHKVHMHKSVHTFDLSKFSLNKLFFERVPEMLKCQWTPSEGQSEDLIWTQYAWAVCTIYCHIHNWWSLNWKSSVFAAGVSCYDSDKKQKGAAEDWCRTVFINTPWVSVSRSCCSASLARTCWLWNCLQTALTCSSLTLWRFFSNLGLTFPLFDLAECCSHLLCFQRTADSSEG